MLIAVLTNLSFFLIIIYLRLVPLRTNIHFLSLAREKIWTIWLAREEFYIFDQLFLSNSCVLLEHRIVLMFHNGFRVFLEVEMYFIGNTKHVFKSDALRYVCFLNHSFLSERFNKEWVLIINQSSHGSLMQYWQIFYWFLIFCCYFTRLKSSGMNLENISNL